MKFGFLRTTGAVLVLATCMTACAPFLVAGVAGSALVATDRRTSGTQLEDETIELRVSAKVRDTFGEKVHVNVTSYNRQVLLTGEVPSEKERQAVTAIAEKVENVKSVMNELTAMPITSLGSRSNDLIVTGKIKATLVDSRDLFANAFKVVTERNTVYLMGRVTQREADSATALIRNVNGVNKVVRMFEIISEEELRGLLPAPADKPDADKSKK
ncbi:MAG: BON domain-containing protein [Betaproteobacteria bacterium]|jgi:osmotically-inducible protein OsmY|nr:BON domain-containing protein [Betaproteobacteria bacterium]